ncbi:MAG: cation-transporting P-type ATPase, partial [Xanthobacteraceae bacterium]
MRRPVHQTTGKRSPKGAPAQAAPEIFDLAAVPFRDLLQRLHSSDTGLSASDAASILKTVGPNEVESAKPKSLLSSIVERFSNPLVLILLFAAAVSAFTGDVPSFAIIAAIVLMSVIL